VETPVLLIIFKRPAHTRRVLETLRQAKPRTLLVAADGPRHAGEAAECEQARRVIGEVDWECTVETSYATENLGCGIRVYTAIDWAMEKHDRLIILEDDCIAAPSFFPYCENLLERYRDDERIMHISGNNFQSAPPASGDSYYFSKYTHAWGWATWKRAWRHFDWKVSRWPEARRAELLETICDDPYEQRYWGNLFDQVYRGAPDIWDYQWNLSCWMQNGLAILPAVNLVSNIGHGPDATHTKDPSIYLDRPTFPLEAIQHPPIIVRNRGFDAYTFANNFGGAEMKRLDSASVRWKTRLRPFLAPILALRRAWRARQSSVS